VYLAFSIQIAMQSNLLQIKNLTVSFPQKSKVVNQISFTIGKGEVMGIVGESGSGKTVSSLALMQLISNAKISADEFFFYKDDLVPIDLIKASADEMQKIRGKEIAMIFQNPMTSFNPVLTCGEQVMEAILVHQSISKKEAKLKTIEWFTKVELTNAEEVFERYPHQLSGGQKQRVMIAMAMCNYPKLLIADEPTTALDVTLQFSLLRLMKKLQAEHQMAMLFISHDLNVVKLMADRIMVMKDGECVEYNDSKSIFENPKHDYTKSLLANRISLNSNTLSSSKVATDVILEVKNISIEYNITQKLAWKQHYKKVVDSVSFTIHKGEILGLVGESGSGKTTIGKAIVLLNEIANGEILFHQQSIHQFKKNELFHYRKKVQFIFQDSYSSLNPKQKVGDVIVEALLLHKLAKDLSEAKTKALHWFSLVNLDENLFNRFPDELSGGQRQRINLARALCIEPVLVIADEPVSSLDVSLQSAIIDLLKNLQSKFGFSCLFISHDLAIVNYLCDKIIVLKDGVIVEEGYTSAILQHPQHSYTKLLLESVV
jgi:peptide/nickel transport system ATP-binding protein